MEMILYFPNNGDGNYFIMIITLIMSLYKLKIFERKWHLHTNNLQLSTRQAKLLPLVILQLHHLQHTGLAASPPQSFPFLLIIDSHYVTILRYKELRDLLCVALLIS